MKYETTGYTEESVTHVVLDDDVVIVYVEKKEELKWKNF